MKRSEVYKTISMDIATRMKSKSIIDQDRYNDISDDVTNDNFHELFNPEYGQLGIYEGLAKQISSWDGNDDYDISVCSNYKVGAVKQEYKHYYRKFSKKVDDNFAFISTGILHNIQNDVDDKTLKVIESIWAVIANSNDAKDEFWDFVETLDDDKHIIVTDYPANNDEEMWRLYAYASFNYVNGCSHEMDTRLHFNRETAFAPQISFTADKPYEQYFEVFDLMSEGHYCDDILSRFLNMYQILENMVYRRHIVILSSGDFKRNKFIRKTISTVSRAFKAENEEVPRGIREILPNLGDEIPTGTFSANAIKFIKDEYQLNIGSTWDSTIIAKLIYNLRNSIVHNKANELHFSFENVEEYEVMIPVIKVLISNVERLIVARVNLYQSGETKTEHPLEFTNEKLPLY